MNGVEHRNEIEQLTLHIEELEGEIGQAKLSINNLLEIIFKYNICTDDMEDSCIRIAMKRSEHSADVDFWDAVAPAFSVKKEGCQYQNCEWNGNECEKCNLVTDTQNSDICEWFDDDDGWHGSCGKDWEFTYDGPTENGLKFCMNCGKPVILDDETLSEKDSDER